jgi:hypothetical protein
MNQNQEDTCGCPLCTLRRGFEAGIVDALLRGKKYVIFDLDNCIADDEHRINLIDWNKSGSERYEAYHAAHIQDRCVQDHFPQFLKEVEPIFITGRPEKYRQTTLDWLEENGVLLNAASHSLWMRPNGCEYDSVRLKLNVIKHLEHAHGILPSEIVVAYDDREDVVAMYNAHGVNAEVLAIHDTPYDKFKDIQTGSVSAKAQAVSEMSQEDKEQRKSPVVEISMSSVREFFDKLFGSELEEIAHNPAQVLHDMAETYEERNKVYGDNYKRVGAVMTAMFPDGVQLKTEEDFNRWHLFELKIVKLTRFANSGLLHKDSIHDDAVYSAMVESLIHDKTKPIGSGVKQGGENE